MIVPVFIAIVAVVAVWALLDWREKRRVAQGLSRQSGLRLVFASIALLTVLFSGGCGSFILGGMVMNGFRSDQYVTWEAVAVFTLPPLLLGILVWWLAMRRKSG